MRSMHRRHGTTARDEATKLVLLYDTLTASPLAFRVFQFPIPTGAIACLDESGDAVSPPGRARSTHPSRRVPRFRAGDITQTGFQVAVAGGRPRGSFLSSEEPIFFFEFQNSLACCTSYQSPGRLATIHFSRKLAGSVHPDRLGTPEAGICRRRWPPTLRILWWKTSRFRQQVLLRLLCLCFRHRDPWS